MGNVRGDMRDGNLEGEGSVVPIPQSFKSFQSRFRQSPSTPKSFQSEFRQPIMYHHITLHHFTSCRSHFKHYA